MVLHKYNDINQNDDSENFEIIRYIVADQINEFLKKKMLGKFFPLRQFFFSLAEK
jgi:hypothetical protein